ncbi:MAG TPA: DUF2723 domain-containing protein [Candidatus Deferrimicrobium sp.]|nr:DUF2723 domain-containing protein [Candidatus Deferrimicrobium sp.]
MKSRFDQSFELPHALVGLGVWLSTFLVYAATKAPTLSFWDCGELIAASRILGIPHPPGSPLYVLFGRLFSVLPLWSDIGARVNFLSVLSSSFAALFGYLASVRLLRAWFGAERTQFTRVLTYAGGASGAFFLAFGFTNWNNAVEAEVYGLTMMLMTSMLWLMTVAADKRGTPAAERILLLIVYLGFLGIGVHMTSFVVVPIAALFLIVKKDFGAAAWFAVVIFMGFVLYLVFALSSRPGELPYHVPVLIVFLLYLFYVFSFERVPARHLIVGLGFLLAAIPFLPDALNAWGETKSVRLVSDSTVSHIRVVGLTALAGLILFALYSLYRYSTARRRNSYKITFPAHSAFILTAALMALLKYSPKGETAFLILSGAVGLALLVTIRRFINWPMLAAVAGISLVVIGVKPFFYGVLGSAVVVLALGSIGRLPGWKSALMVLLCALSGYSVHLFIPIRSAQQPAINENNPSQSLSATISFLERKQYGSTSMVSRMFQRRGDWANQFGDHERMGFWRFFHEQYGLTGPRFVPLLLLGVFGVWEIVRRRPDVGLTFLLLLLVSSVGLILYMNFADGTRQTSTGADYIEVRDRDYFFTPAFVFFGLAIGVGSALAIQFVREAATRLSRVPRIALAGMSLLLLALPTVALTANYRQCNRSGNVVPYDYGWNLLTAADSNAVLFTYGDNDTFPLWCLQEAYGIRRDVRVVNLSLANTNWYIKQIQSHMGLKLAWTEQEIDALRPFRTPEGSVFRIQDQVIDAIIINNHETAPINFAMTVSPGAMKFQGKPLDSLLELNGFVWRLRPSGEPLRVNAEASYRFLTDPEKFRCRGVNDPSVYKDETTLRMTSHWSSQFVAVADALARSGQREKAEHLLERAVQQLPNASLAVEYLARRYGEDGKVDKLRALIDQTVVADKRPLKVILGRTERNRQNAGEAERIFAELLAADAGYRPAFQELARLYFAARQMTALRRLFQQWVAYNPEDKEVDRMLRELDKQSGSLDTSIAKDS